MKPIIEVDDVSFSYGSSDSYALRHVTLDVAQGSFVGIIGPSGAGKSTLAACLSGAVPHHYAGKLFGAVRVKGQDTCEISLTDISQIVGSVLQDIDAQMVASVVEDEMLFGLENFGAPHDQIEQRIASTLETVGMLRFRVAKNKRSPLPPSWRSRPMCSYSTSQPRHSIRQARHWCSTHSVKSIGSTASPSW